jgi:hypothetical protein
VQCCVNVVELRWLGMQWWMLWKAFCVLLGARVCVYAPASAHYCWTKSWLCIHPSIRLWSSNDHSWFPEPDKQEILFHPPIIFHIFYLNVEELTHLLFVLYVLDCKLSIYHVRYQKSMRYSNMRLLLSYGRHVTFSQTAGAMLNLPCLQRSLHAA